MAATILDMPIGEVFADRPVLARLVRAIQLDSGGSWLDAMDAFHKGSDFARGTATPTVRTALEWAQADPEFVEEALTLLERRYGAVDAAYRQAAAPLMLEQVDRQGLVLLDAAVQPPLLPHRQTVPRVPVADAAKAIADPVERERRFLRGRQMSPRYQGAEGRKMFDADDLLHLRSGRDIVRTFERGLEQANARAKAREVGRRLDKAIADAGRDRQRLKALEGEIGKLGNTAARDAARSEINTQLKATTHVPLKMLDAVETEADRPVALDASPADGTPSDQKRLEQLRRTQTPSAFLKTLEAYVATGALPDTDAAAPAVPPGVHPGSHTMAKRVRERLKLLDRPDSAYQQTLLEIMVEDEEA
jgi:hypothetical protein